MSLPEHPRIAAETLIRNIPSILLVFGPEGELLTWNGAAATTLGLGSPGEEGGGRHLSAMLDQAVADSMSQCAMMRVDECMIEVNGTQRKLGFTANPMEEEGRVVGAIVTGRDITERVKVSDQIDDLRRRAGIERIARQVAHELRNPLNSIKVHSQYLQLGFAADDPANAYAKIIISEVNRMDKLLTGLRDLSRAQEITLSLGSAEEAIVNAFGLMRPVARCKGVEIKLKLGETPEVLHDSAKIEQVLINLLKNAVEATMAGSHVVMRASTSAQGALNVEVLDDGPGIDPEDAERIFDLFYSTKGKTGEGVGLAICREIVERHRGTIALVPVQGWSTCFRVEIPPP